MKRNDYIRHGLVLEDVLSMHTAIGTSGLYGARNEGSICDVYQQGDPKILLNTGLAVVSRKPYFNGDLQITNRGIEVHDMTVDYFRQLTTLDKDSLGSLLFYRNPRHARNRSFQMARDHKLKSFLDAELWILSEPFTPFSIGSGEDIVSAGDKKPVVIRIADFSDKGIDTLRNVLDYFVGIVYSKVIDDCTEKLTSTPNDQGLHSTRASALLQLERFDEAITEFSELIDLGRSEPKTLKDAYSDRGRVLLTVKKFAEAKDDFDQAIKLSNECALERDPAIYRDRGLTHLNLGEYVQAMSDFNSAEAFVESEGRSVDRRLKREYIPYKAQIHCYKGDALRLTGNIDDAVKQYSYALGWADAILMGDDMLELAIRIQRTLASLCNNGLLLPRDAMKHLVNTPLNPFEQGYYNGKTEVRLNTGGLKEKSVLADHILSREELDMIKVFEKKV